MKKAISSWMTFRTLVDQGSMLSAMFVAKLYSHLVGIITNNLFYECKNYADVSVRACDIH